MHMPTCPTEISQMNIWKCENERHQCGKMIEHNAAIPRCRAYLRDYKNVTERKTTYLTWHQIIRNAERNVEATTTYARPQNCIRDGKLVDSASSAEPYIAISYAWDISPSFKKWEGRRVTEQALHIADRLSKHTSYALWIDAICIDQDNEPVKMVELAKMADIYRGAAAVLCLVPEIDQTASRVVEHGTGMIDLDGFRALEQAGDTHGMYMFASQGSNNALHKLFSSRWWTRVWTFQEAVLHRITFLVGEKEETIHISDVLKISHPISRRAATQKKDNLLGQSSSFWDSVHSMSNAMKAYMPLGTAISSVWRRQSTVTHDMAYSLLGVCRLETITPDYRLPVEKVFADLVDKASSKGDFSWLRWSHLVDRDAACEGMSMVPVPATVLATPASAITEWRSVEVPQMSVVRGGAVGVCIPHRSTGVIRWQSQPEDIKGVIDMLQKLSYGPEDIWNLLFGLHVGFACDVDRAVGGSGLAQALLNLATGYIDGTIKLEDSEDDLVGDKPYTRGYGFTAYASMAAKVWRNTQLVVMRSQGGTTVVPTHSGTGQARLHRLPVESHRGTCLCLVVHDNTKFRASAIGVMVEEDHAGSGSWQFTRFS